jgi:hypothetical protein
MFDLENLPQRKDLMVKREDRMFAFVAISMSEVAAESGFDINLAKAAVDAGMDHLPKSLLLLPPGNLNKSFVKKAEVTY